MVHRARRTDGQALRREGLADDRSQASKRNFDRTSPYDVRTAAEAFVLILPATGAASGYLQAWLKFCAGFGARGVFNFGALGDWTSVTDREALARDRRRSREIGGMALAVGVAVGIVAVLLPI